MVGEYPISLEALAARRDDEAAIEDSNSETRRRNAIVVEKLVKALCLAGVVAEDRGRNSVGDYLL